MNVAIIPARGGSKRIPRKNIKDFAGKPVIAYSIEAAIESGVFDKVIVSTDDADVADVATSFGADVPFLRPPELSDDITPTAPVLLHALHALESSLGTIDYFGCIYATAPFVRARDLRDAYELLRREGGRLAFSVTRFSFPIYRGMERSSDGRVNFIWPEHKATRSQDLPEAYHDAGMFYVYPTAAFFELEHQYDGCDMPLILPDAIPLELPQERVQDIDTPEDWRAAETKFRVLQEEETV